MDHLAQHFTELPNVIPDLVPQLIERGDPTLASLYIDLNAQTRKVYERSMELMESNSTMDFDQMVENLEESKALLKDSLELMIMLIERHPDLALWVFKQMTVNQMENL